MQAIDAVQAATAKLIPTKNLTRLIFSVYVDDILTNASSGTYIIPGDPESYFYCAPNSILVSQG
jgi:hypothetical protein